MTAGLLLPSWMRNARALAVSIVCANPAKWCGVFCAERIPRHAAKVSDVHAEDALLIQVLQPDEQLFLLAAIQ